MLGERRALTCERCKGRMPETKLVSEFQTGKFVMAIAGGAKGDPTKPGTVYLCYRCMRSLPLDIRMGR